MKKCWIFLAWCLLTMDLAAQGNNLLLEDKRIEVKTAFVDGGTYFGNVALKSPALPDGTSQLTCTAFISDLVRQDSPGVVVERGQITLKNATINLSPDRLLNLRLEFKNIPLPGRYQGELALFYKLNGESQRQNIPISLSLWDEAQPILSPQNPTTINLVAHESWVDYILPGAASVDTLAFSIQNPRVLPLHLKQYSAQFQGQQRDGGHLDKSDFPLAAPDWSLAQGQSDFIKFRQLATPLRPGAYSGSFTLQFADASVAPVHIPLSIQVKAGAAWALIALILGLLAGRVLKAVNSEDGKMQVRLLQEKQLIEMDLRRIQDKKARQVLLNALKSLISDINSAKAEDENTILEKLKQIDLQLEEILRLERYGEEVNKDMKQAITQKQAIDKTAGLKFNTLWDHIRDLILENKLAEVKAEWGTLEQLADKLLGRTQRTYKPKGGLIFPQQPQTENTTTANEEPDTSADKSWYQAVGDFFFRVFSWIFRVLFGLQSASSRVTFWFLRPLVGVITYLGILLIGLETIYLEGGATFGANGIYDYLKLFIWGISTDVVSRTFGDFALKSGSDKGSFSLKGV